MKSICVFLGAREGTHPAIRETAITLGSEIARRNLTLVYGGSSLGLMGQLARAAKDEGGTVIGIMPKGLIDLEVPPTYLDELIIVESITDRKHMMIKRSGALLAMPGGLGTLEEVFEVWSALRLGLLGNKTFGFLNVEGYFDQLFAFMNTCVEFGFVSEAHKNLPKISNNAVQLVAELCCGG